MGKREPIRKKRAAHDFAQAAITQGAHDDDDDDEGPGIFLVDCLVDHRVRSKQTQYLVKWLGYPDGQNTWEPAAGLPAEAIQEYVDGGKLANGQLSAPAEKPSTPSQKAHRISQESNLRVTADESVLEQQFACGGPGREGDARQKVSSAGDSGRSRSITAQGKQPRAWSPDPPRSSGRNSRVGRDVWTQTAPPSGIDGQLPERHAVAGYHKWQHLALPMFPPGTLVALPTHIPEGFQPDMGHAIGQGSSHNGSAQSDPVLPSGVPAGSIPITGGVLPAGCVAVPSMNSAQMRRNGIILRPPSIPTLPTTVASPQRGSIRAGIAGSAATSTALGRKPNPAPPRAVAREGVNSTPHPSIGSSPPQLTLLNTTSPPAPLVTVPALNGARPLGQGARVARDVSPAAAASGVNGVPGTFSPSPPRAPRGQLGHQEKRQRRHSPNGTAP